MTKEIITKSCLIVGHCRCIQIILNYNQLSTNYKQTSFHYTQLIHYFEDYDWIILDYNCFGRIHRHSRLVSAINCQQIITNYTAKMFSVCVVNSALRLFSVCIVNSPSRLLSVCVNHGWSTVIWDCQVLIWSTVLPDCWIWMVIIIIVDVMYDWNSVIGIILYYLLIVILD